MSAHCPRVLGAFAATVLAFGVAAAAGRPYAGRALSEVLAELRDAGLRVIYSTGLVAADLVVRDEPRATTPEAILEEILRPHGLRIARGPRQTLLVVRDVGPAAAGTGRILGTAIAGAGPERPIAARIELDGTGIGVTCDAGGRFAVDVEPGTYTLSASAPGFIAQRLAGLAVGSGKTVEVRFRLARYEPHLESVLVLPPVGPGEPSDAYAPEAIGAEALDASPRYGDDPLRSVVRLPGSAESELSAQPHVRGGRSDETLIVLDGMELHAPFHLQDVQGGLFSIVDSASVDRIDYFSGGFPVRYGNRMSGVIDIRSAAPGGEATTGITLANDYARVDAGGGIGRDRGHWLVTVRHGYPTSGLPEIVAEENYDPRYTDLLAKVAWRLGRETTLAANLLLADDDTVNPAETSTPGDEPTNVSTSYGSSYAWLTLTSMWSADLQSRTLLSFGDLRQDRRVAEDDTSTVRDDRDSRTLGLRQDWSRTWGRRNGLSFGFDVRAVEADYDYRAVPVDEDEAAQQADLHPSGGEYALYVAHTFRPVAWLTTDIGLRWDSESYSDLDEHHLSPRVGLLFAPTSRDAIRLSVGRFHQSQRTYELQVEDGVRRFQPAEASDRANLSWGHTFANEWSLQVAGYVGEVEDPRARFENFLDPVTLYPEAQDDRILIAADRVESRGVEISWIGRTRWHLDWRLGFSLSEAVDVVDGREVVRSWDETEALDLTLNYAPSKAWNFQLAASLHTGWPTTPVYPTRTATDEGTLLVGTGLGDRNTARLPDYRRVDVRASRIIDPGPGMLSLFVEVTNLFDADNACCTEDFDFEPAEEAGSLSQRYKYGLPRTTRFGATWRF